MSGLVADNAGRASGVIASSGGGGGGKLLAMETVTNSTRTATPATGSAGVVTSLLSAYFSKSDIADISVIDISISISLSFFTSLRFRLRSSDLITGSVIISLVRKL